jgi:hypothetical protein
VWKLEYRDADGVHVKETIGRSQTEQCGVKQRRPFGAALSASSRKAIGRPTDHVPRTTPDVVPVRGDWETADFLLDPLSAAISSPTKQSRSDAAT